MIVLFDTSIHNYVILISTLTIDRGVLMTTIKNFFLVVVNLIGDLWFGLLRKPSFYDNHTVTKTKIGYALFVSLAGFITLGTITWLCIRIYG